MQCAEKAISEIPACKDGFGYSLKGCTTWLESSIKLRGACLTLAGGCSPKNGDKRKRALSGASLAAAMANHQHVLFDDEGVGRSPRSVAAKAR